MDQFDFGEKIENLLEDGYVLRCLIRRCDPISVWFPKFKFRT